MSSTFDETRINMEDEVRKLAVADGYDDSSSLKTPLSMTRREYYASTVVAHYRGYDAGYAQAARNIARMVRHARILSVVGVACMVLVIGIAAYLKWGAHVAG
jgi:hypothetical protein